MNDLLVIIPAIKKSAVIPDQLIKKLDGITLIQRAINTAKKITNNILIITDSQEISLIAQRNSIEVYYEATLFFNTDNILEKTINIINNKSDKYILLYRANTPLVDNLILKEAYKEFLIDDSYILSSVKNLDKQLLKQENNNLVKVKKRYFKELKSFLIFKKDMNEIKYRPYILKEEKSIEIESYQDWWVCEKILQRKRIVFNVIGDIKIGMGHIYHSLALAHEITNHEVIFVCDQKYKIAVEKIASMDYKVISSSDVLNEIIRLKPDLVINDILNTKKEYILKLKEENIKVVNFEDLGEGARFADLVFNELYDKPLKEGNHYLWGHQYLALRDEFVDATQHTVDEEIKGILLSFGGTDQNNLTLLTLKAILPILRDTNIKIHILCGSGYMFKNELEEYIDSVQNKNIKLYFEVANVSSIMEQTQLAISSNGRTVYELADMNIPAIIISHHNREASHSFATLDKGFINLGVFNKNISDKIRDKLSKLIEDKEYRKLLFLNIKKYSFRDNKKKVVKKIMELL